jgi:hypothetical protein
VHALKSRVAVRVRRQHRQGPDRHPPGAAGPYGGGCRRVPAGDMACPHRFASETRVDRRGTAPGPSPNAARCAPSTDATTIGLVFARRTTLPMILGGSWRYLVRTCRLAGGRQPTRIRHPALN